MLAFYPDNASQQPGNLPDVLLHETAVAWVRLRETITSGKKGVDEKTTDAWVYQSTRPRVDANSEKRGPWHWLRAAQHGHFYCSVHKLGALHTATNYPPWDAGWAPDVSWVTNLWRQHKLTHAGYLALSAKLRDGHDRRKRDVEAVMMTESASAFAAERAWARRELARKALPFKPLGPDVERWMMAHEEIEERYQILVFHGPSCTGKNILRPFQGGNYSADVAWIVKNFSRGRA